MSTLPGYIPDATAPGLGWVPTLWHRLLHDRRNVTGILADANGALDTLLRDDLLKDKDPIVHPNAVGDLSRGLYAHLYNEPDAQPEGPAWVRAAVKSINDTPEVDSIRQSVRSDPDMTAIATASMIRAITEKLPELMQALEDAGVDPESTDDTAGEDDEDGEGMAMAIEDAAGKMQRAIRHAVTDAVGDVAEAREVLNGILPGMGGAPPVAEQEDPRRLALVERALKDDRLRRVLQIAGRIQRISDRVRMTRSDTSREEVIDIERGADIGRILPSELAGLRHPTLRKLVKKGLADRSLLQYRLSGHEPLGRGPIVVCLDVSSSMFATMPGGLRLIDWASAIGIASVRTAVLQKRPVRVVLFNDYTGQSWVLDGRTDRRAAEKAILDLTGIRASGGTNFDAPLNWGLDNGAEQDRADLILVTDGYANIRPETMTRIEAAKTRGVRVWGIQLTGAADVGALESVCDGIAIVTDEKTAAERIGGLGAA